MQQQRIANIQDQLNLGQALLVTGDANRFYLTGFRSSAGLVLVTKERALFLVDFRYAEKAKTTVTSCEVQLSTRPMEEVQRALDSEGVSTLFVETYEMSIYQRARYQSELFGVDVSQSSEMDELLEKMRSVKSEEELSCIRAAQQMTDETFSYILERITSGRSEKEIMLDIEFFMRRLGSEGVSFDFIVVSGPNSSLPHGVPTTRLVQNGDFVTMDFGAVVNGYRSDMTRTVAVGNVSSEQKQVYQSVLRAQKLALSAIAPEQVCCDIDRIARDDIDSAGYQGCFGHGLGHSVGLEIHENPCFNTRCQTVLRPGMIMTVEPGIYLEGQFGVRIEDMVVVTPGGCENLTHSPKELLVL